MQTGPGAGAWPQRRELAARVFEVVGGEPDRAAAPLPSRSRLSAPFAGMLGVVVGLLLAVLLSHTAFAHDRGCHGSTGASACLRAGR